MFWKFSIICPILQVWGRLGEKGRQIPTYCLSPDASIWKKEFASLGHLSFIFPPHPWMPACITWVSSFIRKRKHVVYQLLQGIKLCILYIHLFIQQITIHIQKNCMQSTKDRVNHTFCWRNSGLERKDKSPRMKGDLCFLATKEIGLLQTHQKIFFNIYF